MKNLLFAWLGQTDINASERKTGVGDGPICAALRKSDFDKAVIISNYAIEKSLHYSKWITPRVKTLVGIENVELANPTDFQEIYEAATAVIEKTLKGYADEAVNLTYHLSPGTPAMGQIWLLIAISSHPAGLIKTSPESGVEAVQLPFKISAEYAPAPTHEQKKELDALLDGTVPQAAEFSSVIHSSHEMKEVIAQARHVARYDVPVLLLGESGTGKELFAKAIHNSGARKEGPFIAVNCGAIAESLFEAEFFGYKKGAFTGAARNKEGYFEAANGGTLFLDEIGDLPLYLQVKLLRAIQSRSVTRVGDTAAREFNVRVIAATNKDLIREVAAGNFRDDLFHRIAHGIIKIPPLRERRGDVTLLTDHFLKEACEKLGIAPKTFSPDARQMLINYDWPGNVRELSNTITRLMIWGAIEKITIRDVEKHLIKMPKGLDSAIDVSIGEGFKMDDFLNNIKVQILKKADKESNGSPVKAARLLGIKNYQTYSNLKRKYLE